MLLFLVTYTWYLCPANNRHNTRHLFLPPQGQGWRGRRRRLSLESLEAAILISLHALLLNKTAHSLSVAVTVQWTSLHRVAFRGFDWGNSLLGSQKNDVTYYSDRDRRRQKHEKEQRLGSESCDISNRQTETVRCHSRVNKLRLILYSSAFFTNFKCTVSALVCFPPLSYFVAASRVASYFRTISCQETSYQLGKPLPPPYNWVEHSLLVWYNNSLNAEWLTD